MRRRAAVSAGLFLAVVGVAFGQERLDFADRATPRCEIEGLVAVPPPGWLNVPIANPPAGNRGCMMIRTNENEEPVGILRIRSLAAPALKKDGEPFEALFISEVEALDRMGCAILDQEPLFVRSDVPIKGDGFRDGKGIGFAAAIEGNRVPQEVHLLMFRSERAEYIVSLAMPAKSHDAKLWDRNTEDFGTLIRTLQQPGK